MGRTRTAKRGGRSFWRLNHGPDVILPGSMPSIQVANKPRRAADPSTAKELTGADVLCLEPVNKSVEVGQGAGEARKLF